MTLAMKHIIGDLSRKAKGKAVYFTVEAFKQLYISNKMEPFNIKGGCGTILLRI